MEELEFNFEEELKKLPDLPGVYLMHGDLDEVIYVGKAIVLKNRVRQYFQSGRGKTTKILQMVDHIRRFEYIVTDSEAEALVLEDLRFAFAVGSFSSDTVVAFLDARDKIREHRRRVLQIRIHHDDIIAGRIRKAGIHSGFLSEVAGKTDVAHFGMGLGEFTHDADRPVAASVIHQDETKIVAFDLIAPGTCDLVKVIQYLFFIVTGYYDIDGFHNLSI